MKYILLFLLPLLIHESSLGQNNIIIDNHTYQRIYPLQYWIGPETQSENPNIQYRERPGLDSGQLGYKVPLNYHKKKRNTIRVKAYLSGGGYITAKYNIENGEPEARIPLYNPSSFTSEDDFKTVIEKFKEFNFDKGYLKITSLNGLQSTLGGIIIVDESEKIVLYNITPKELKSELPNICKHSNIDYAMGTFSSKTSASGNISLPFVSVNSAFSSGDLASFKWTIENAGECLWSPPGEKDLATLFSELSPKTKNALIQVYKENPKSRMKFINKVFTIGRIEVETTKSKSIERNAEILGSSFVTAKGNFNLIDDFITENIINDIITKVDGHYITGLLANLYLLNLAETEIKLSEQENTRLINEFKYLLNLYPDELNSTDDPELMKKQIIDLNMKNNGEVSYLNKTEGNVEIKLEEVVNSPEILGEIKNNEEI